MMEMQTFPLNFWAGLEMKRVGGKQVFSVAKIRFQVLGVSGAVVTVRKRQV